MIHLFASATSFSWYWFWHPLAGPGYQFWSGAASDIGEITLIGAVFAWYKHNQCEQEKCWRFGHKHPDHGRPVCRPHYSSHEPPAKDGASK